MLFRQNGALLHRKAFPQHRSLLLPPHGSVGATVMVSKALMSWNLLQEKLMSSCFVPLLLGLTSKCICELCLAFKGGTLQRRSKGTGLFWSGPSAGLEKHPRAWRTRQGLRSPACKELSTLHPSLGAGYPPDRKCHRLRKGQEAGQSQTEGGQGCVRVGRGACIHTQKQEGRGEGLRPRGRAT